MVRLEERINMKSSVTMRHGKTTPYSDTTQIDHNGCHYEHINNNGNTDGDLIHGELWATPRGIN
jgi:hypothetical protein